MILEGKDYGMKKGRISFPFVYLPLLSFVRLQVMKDSNRTKAEIISELKKLRLRTADLEAEQKERELMHEAIREREERLFAFFEHLGDAVYFSTRDGAIVEVNPSAVKLFGYAGRGMTHLNVKDLYDDSAETETVQNAIDQNGSVKDYRVTFRKKDGTKMQCLLTSTVLRDSIGNVTGYQGVIRDDTALKIAEDPLKLSEEKFFRVFRSSPDWIAISSLFEGRFIDVNDAFLKHTGYSRNEVIGRTSFELGLWVDPKEREKMVTLLLEQGEIRDHETKFRMKSGEILTMQRSSELIDYGSEKCMLTITRDITERKKSEERIQNLNAELQRRISELSEANKDLDAFTATVSHDLKMPLTVIGGFARVLMKAHSNNIDTAGKELLNEIQTYVGRMEKLIEDLLAFSRSGRQKMNISRVDMGNLVRTVVEELRELYVGRTVEVIIQPLPPAYADYSLIHQVLVNLLLNAFKFTRQREDAAIEVACLEDKNEVTYYVRDNGVGFDAKYQGGLFGAFQQLHRSRQFGGTGVGLSIVKRIIERHGGRVWAEGKVDEGATFFFTLPRGQSDEPD
ncbi:MAG: sensor histidine kinase [Dissulfurispiraceae bacterium]